MSAPSYSDSPRSPTTYLGQTYRFAPVYIRKRDPLNGTDGTPFTSPDTRPKENQGFYPVGTFWVNVLLNRLWVCTAYGVDANTHTCAHWELLESSGVTGTEQFLLPDTHVITPTGTPPQVTFQNGAGISVTQGTDGHSILITNTSAGGTAVTGVHPDAHTAPGTDPVVPDLSGNIKIEGGATFATGTQANPIRTNSLAANTFDLQIQQAGSNAAVSAPNNFGVAQFDSNQFNVALGFVQLKGGGTAPTLGVHPDTHTAPGTDPVIPDLSGNIKIEGGTTFATGTQANPIRTNSLAANTIDLQIQLAGSNPAVSTANDFGVSQFDGNQFTVTSGFVQLKGGGTAPTLGIHPDGFVGPGTDPVVPDGSGNIRIEGGATFATGTQANPIRTRSLAANTMDLQVQLAGSNAAVSTPNDFGVAQFDSNAFGVASGFVTLNNGGTTGAITKVALDTGTSPIVPTAGQITLTGGQVLAGTNPIRTDGTGPSTAKIEVQISQTKGVSTSSANGICHFDSASFAVDANGFVTFIGGGGVTPTITLTKFTSSGTWTKLASTQYVAVMIWNGGGGGGSGARNTSTNAGGGGGGAGAGGLYWEAYAGAFGATETVTIAGTAAGGVAQTADNTSGNNGTVNNVSKFGNLQYNDSANSYGRGGTTTSSLGGDQTHFAYELPGTTTTVLAVSPAGVGTNTTGVNATNVGININDKYFAGSGGGGSGANSASAQQAGNGSSIVPFLSGSTISAGGAGGIESGTVAGGTGANFAITGGLLFGGAGGGGGGGMKAIAAGAGGAGGTPGGGGGGGGGALNGNNSGAGGQGARGEIWVWEYN